MTIARTISCPIPKKSFKQRPANRVLTDKELVTIFKSNPAKLLTIRQTKRVVELAVKTNYECLKYVKRQSTEIIRLALANNMRASKYADLALLTEDMWIDIIAFDHKMYLKCTSPTVKIKIFAAAYCPFEASQIVLPPEEVIETFLAELPSAIKLIEHPTPQQKEVALKSDPLAFFLIKNRTPDDIRTVIPLMPSIIEYIDNPSPDIIELGVERDFTIIRFFNNLPDKILQKAIDQSVSALEYIRPQTSQLIEYALSIDKNAICYIKNPTVKHLEYALGNRWFEIHSDQNIPVDIIVQLLRNRPDLIDRVISLAKKRTHNYPYILFHAVPDVRRHCTNTIYMNMLLAYMERQTTVLTDVCPVCYENVGSKTIKQNSCNHVICAGCKVGIMAANRTREVKCPVCRRID